MEVRKNLRPTSASRVLFPDSNENYNREVARLASSRPKDVSAKVLAIDRAGSNAWQDGSSLNSYVAYVSSSLADKVTVGQYEIMELAFWKDPKSKNSHVAICLYPFAEFLNRADLPTPYERFYDSYHCLYQGELKIANKDVEKYEENIEKLTIKLSAKGAVASFKSKELLGAVDAWVTSISIGN